MRKSLLILFSFFLLITGTRADEGMWIPLLLKQIEGDMQSKGFKLTAEDIYSVNHGSMKDAVVHFGGGCTGEIISDQGLLLTNHHCGYRQIQSHSSVEKNYLKNGFWAMNHTEELPNPGLTATFIVRIEDVTDQMKKGITESMTSAQKDSVYELNSLVIQSSAVTGTHYDAFIRPFYYGNEYYMFVTETFNDIRLVGAPPSSIGKFGGDTDNWMWPRHTGDFSIFRIYAGKDNKPAEYSPENVPFKPRHSFPVSIKGVQPGDFTLVYGFPGRTMEYIPGAAVEMTTETANPARIKIREARLEQIWDDMVKDEAIKIKYAAKYASVSNYYKKWMGENRGLAKANALQVKADRERLFTQRVNANPEWKAKYGHLLPAFDTLYEMMTPYQRAYDYFVEAILGVEILNFPRNFQNLVNKSNDKTVPDSVLQTLAKNLATGAAGFYKDYNAPTDKKVFRELVAIYLEDLPKDQQSETLREMLKKYKNDVHSLADAIYSKSVFTSADKLLPLLENYSRKNAKKIEADPAYHLSVSMLDEFRQNIAPTYSALNEKSQELMETYMEALRVVIPEKTYYPDANSTLRVTYGEVRGYEPRDATRYEAVSTLDGIMEKYIPGDEEFDLPARLIELYEAKDYGPYGQDSIMPVAFIATNHTTGGNSGSPVIDAEGNLIGTNFDRNWEGTMSDIMYDPNQVRNISVDVRYTLFIIDKFAGAKHLIDEMKIVGN